MAGQVSGHLLVPWVASGLDVDGVDVSEDMIDACRAAAQQVGCEPSLYIQPTHELNLPCRHAIHDRVSNHPTPTKSRSNATNAAG